MAIRNIHQTVPIRLIITGFFVIMMNSRYLIILNRYTFTSM